jgi:hypothetical protein
MASKNLSFNIAGGPSKDDLKLALFNQNQLKNPRVDFTVAGENGGQRIDILLKSVEREDGSDERWNIKGTMMNHTHVAIFYCTKDRTGHCSLA